MVRNFDLEKVFVGLDQLYNLAPSWKDYPRYNIGKLENGYKIEMALPGWELPQFEVTFKDGVLTVIGEKQEAEALDWIHRGISGKGFEKMFRLYPDLEVKEATFKNGMLSISMEFPPKKETPTATIPVKEV